MVRASLLSPFMEDVRSLDIIWNPTNDGGSFHWEDCVDKNGHWVTNSKPISYLTLNCESCRIISIERLINISQTFPLLISIYQNMVEFLLDPFVSFLECIHYDDSILVTLVLKHAWPPFEPNVHKTQHFVLVINSKIRKGWYSFSL